MAHVEKIRIRIVAGTPEPLPALPNYFKAIAESFERSLRRVDAVMNMTDEELTELSEAAVALGSTMDRIELPEREEARDE